MIIKKEFTLSEVEFISIVRDVVALGGSTPEKPKKPVGTLRQRSKFIIGIFIFVTFMVLIDNKVIAAAILYYTIFGVYLAFLYFYPLYYYKVFARKQYRTSRALQNTRFIEVSSGGIVSSGEGYKATIDWPGIYKIEKGWHNYLIFLNSASAIGIPLDLLSDDEITALEGYKSQLTPVSS